MITVSSDDNEKFIALFEYMSGENRFGRIYFGFDTIKVPPRLSEELALRAFCLASEEDSFFPIGEQSWYIVADQAGRLLQDRCLGNKSELADNLQGKLPELLQTYSSSARVPELADQLRQLSKDELRLFILFVFSGDENATLVKSELFQRKRETFYALRKLINDILFRKDDG